jgi:hypothetical protein
MTKNSAATRLLRRQHRSLVDVPAELADEIVALVPLCERL